MTTIKAPCSGCGHVDVSSAQVRLVTCTVPARSFYEFSCPTCVTVIRNPATAQVISLLGVAGVESTLWVIPDEAMQTHTGRPISYDDVLDFALALDTVTVVNDFLVRATIPADPFVGA